MRLASANEVKRFGNPRWTNSIYTGWPQFAANHHAFPFEPMPVCWPIPSHEWHHQTHTLTEFNLLPTSITAQFPHESPARNEWGNSQRWKFISNYLVKWLHFPIHGASNWHPLFLLPPGFGHFSGLAGCQASANLIIWPTLSVLMTSDPWVSCSNHNFKTMHSHFLHDDMWPGQTFYPPLPSEFITIFHLGMRPTTFFFFENGQSSEIWNSLHLVCCGSLFRSQVGGFCLIYDSLRANWNGTWLHSLDVHAFKCQKQNRRGRCQMLVITLIFFRIDFFFQQISL